MIKKAKRNHFGFTLIEVMISLTIFSVFMAVYMAAQGYNLADSVMMREEIKLRELCEDTINEIILNPPTLNTSATLSAQTKTFEKHPNYQYKVEYREFKLPDFAKITGKEEGDRGPDPGSNEALEKMLYDKMKENMEKIVWQVEVTVTNLTSKQYYNLSTWLFNNKAKVSFQI